LRVFLLGSRGAVGISATTVRSNSDEIHSSIKSMNTTLKAILATVTLVAAGFNTQAAVTTIGAPLYYGGHNYYLVGQGSWDDSETFAQSLGGHLVTINDAAENAWLTTNFLLPNPTMNPWMGLNDADGNGSWLWASGEAVSYVNWAPGEPSLGFERYGNIYQGTSSYVGQWNNAPGDTVIYGIVEVPEPSSLAIVSLVFLGLGLRKARQSHD
jgi:Lectin C-type domain